MRVSVEEADPPGVRVTLAGATPAVKPDGDTEVERLIVPVNPATLFRLIVAVPELPACTVTELGVDEMVKSPTPTVMVAV